MNNWSFLASVILQARDQTIRFHLKLTSCRGQQNIHCYYSKHVICKNVDAIQCTLKVAPLRKLSKYFHRLFEIFILPSKIYVFHLLHKVASFSVQSDSVLGYKKYLKDSN